MGDKLTELVAQGVSQKFALKALVLERYADITAARQNLRTWGEIAEALGLPKSRGKDMSPCYLRISKSIAAGKLKAGKPAPAGFRAAHNSSNESPVKPSGRINIDDPANQL